MIKSMNHHDVLALAGLLGFLLVLCLALVYARMSDE